LVDVPSPLKPAFTRHVRTHGNELATTLLAAYPAANAFAVATPRTLAKVVCDGRRAVGKLRSAALSVAKHRRPVIAQLPTAGAKA
jgi:hypothetical protein